jgi:hypothetical protein
MKGLSCIGDAGDMDIHTTLDRANPNQGQNSQESYQ